VHDGIGALPNGIGLCPLATLLARAVQGGARWNWLAARAWASSEFYEVSPSRREGARPLWRPWAAGCTTELGRCPSEFYEGSPSRREAWLAARAGASSEFYEGSPSHRGARRNRGVARWNRALPTRDCARKGWAWWGHGGIGWPPVRGIVKILRRLSEPPGGRRWPSEGGSASLDAMRGGVHDGIGVCPHATVPARARHGGGTVELARRPCGGIFRILRRLSETPGGRRSPPEGGPASLEAMDGGVHDGIGALSDRIGLCPLVTVPARGGVRWNWLAACTGVSSEFYESSPSRREAAGVLRRVSRPLWRPCAAGCTTE